MFLGHSGAARRPAVYWGARLAVAPGHVPRGIGHAGAVGLPADLPSWWCPVLARNHCSFAV